MSSPRPLLSIRIHTQLPALLLPEASSETAAEAGQVSQHRQDRLRSQMEQPEEWL